MTFGEKIKNIRIGQKESQEDIAKLLGVSRRTIINYEQGKSLPSSDSDTYKKLAGHFGVSVDFLINEHDNDFEVCAEAAHGLSGKAEADRLANKIIGLYAGGEISDSDAEKVMMAFQRAYWDIREEKMAKGEE